MTCCLNFSISSSVWRKEHIHELEASKKRIIVFCKTIVLILLDDIHLIEFFDDSVLFHLLGTLKSRIRIIQSSWIEPTFSEGLTFQQDSSQSVFSATKWFIVNFNFEIGSQCWLVESSAFSASFEAEHYRQRSWHSRWTNFRPWRRFAETGSLKIKKPNVRRVKNCWFLFCKGCTTRRKIRQTITLWLSAFVLFHW